ncbi:ADP-ribosylglycohydrolase family protein [Sulfurimonas sp. SAG-AH-194-C20]|nr:ADP-ribosylglycohydrolase family protein [Sulfurimonas sp. SAG-AH-194-C20]MDF1878417.1 ADP-ribosylglycohydrolase family protein [Sulfurimonas sp. SAG-AH-194-C20]
MNKSLIALACGDSYGSYFEMAGLMGTTFDAKLLPNKPVNVRITDDTKMANILLKHYLKYKKIKPKVLVGEYRHWANLYGARDGIGIHTSKVLNNQSSDKDSEGNGALMRNIPYALELIKDGYSFEETVIRMNEESALTHENKTIFMANRLALDLALHGISVLEKVIHKDILAKVMLGSTAWVLNTLYIVIQTLKKEFDYLDGFKYIVAAGGDTDTNCAIYAAIKSYKNDINKSIDIEEFLTKKIIHELSNEI